jgi:hypothetical protein
VVNISRFNSSSRSATFAVITFQILDWAQGGDYKLNFIGVGLTNENFEDILGIQLKGASLKVKT